MVSDDDFIDLVQTDRASLVSKVGLLQIEVLDKLLSCACPQDRIFSKGLTISSSYRQAFESGRSCLSIQM